MRVSLHRDVRFLPLDFYSGNFIIPIIEQIFIVVFFPLERITFIEFSLFIIYLICIMISIVYTEYFLFFNESGILNPFYFERIIKKDREN